MVKPSDQAKYLGCHLNNRADPGREVGRRLAECMSTVGRLHHFFYNSGNSVRAKLHVYNAVVRAKVMYGLESTSMNTSVLDRLDAFYLKGLRKILHISPTTEHDRRHHNNYVYQEAAEAVGAEHSPMWQPLSAIHRQRRCWRMAKSSPWKASTQLPPSPWQTTTNPTTTAPGGWGNHGLIGTSAPSMTSGVKPDAHTRTSYTRGRQPSPTHNTWSTYAAWRTSTTSTISPIARAEGQPGRYVT